MHVVSTSLSFIIEQLKPTNFSRSGYSYTVGMSYEYFKEPKFHYFVILIN